jgi:radical SAM protein with 4Fe4S-binding SPASM domain
MPTSLPIYRAEKTRLPLLEEVREIDRSVRPVYCVWEVTLRCDLACRHCGSRAGKTREGELSTEECLDLIAQLADMGVEEVSLIGGEVYLRDDWTELARAVRDHGMECGIVTGGRGITLERAKRARDAGVQAMSVSVDGLQQTHDRLRALRGSWDAAMAALDNLAAVGLARSTNTQINAWNIREIPALLELLIPKGIHAWQVQFTVAMGRAVDEADMLLEPYQMLELLPMLARLKERTDAHDITMWPGNNVGYFGPYESLLRGNMRCGHLEPCTAGRLTLGIEANGDIKGCPSLPTDDYVGGNIREHSLQQIWERAEPLRFTRGRTVDDLWGHCRDCYYAEDCLGGCTWTSHVLFQRRGNNPYCHHRALELLRQGRRERLVLAERAEGRPFDFGRFELIEEDWPEDELAEARALAESGEGFLPISASSAENVPSRTTGSTPHKG